MSGLARFAIDNARFLWLLIAVSVLGGLGAFATQPRQEDPEIALRSAQVVTQLPGLSPERIEQLITRPIEDAIKSIAEIKDIKSISTTGMSIVAPEVDERFSDLDPIWADLRNKMDDLAASLPQGAYGPNVNDDYGSVSVVTMALTGADYSMAELRTVARDLQQTLGALPLVARVDLHGAQPERIWIEFDPAFLAQFGLRPSSIVEALQGQNIVLPGGTVAASGTDVVIEPSGDLRSMDELKSVSIETEQGNLVYLEDLATIRRGYVDPPQAPSYYNGKKAIVLGLSMVAKSNVVELGRQVRGTLAQLTPRLPLGMDLDVVIFQPDLVQASVSAATSNLLQTMVVVLVVVMLFLGLRTGLIVGAMVPLTMMVTLIGMSIWGIELHRISIAAIIVALGLLVDNGVVIAEDIRKRLDEGTPRLDAVLATPKQLAVPLLTSSLTTVAAFLPLCLVSGGSGEFLRSLGQVLALALMASWVIGITVTPVFCYWFLPKHLGRSGEVGASGKATSASSNAGKATAGKSAPSPRDPYGSIAYRGFRKTLVLALRFRVVFVAMMIALLISSGMIFGLVKKRSLGPSERNQFTVYLDLPAGSAIDQTIASASRVVDFLTDKERNPEVTDVLSYVGAGGPRFFLALSPNDPQPNKAFMVVNTETSDQIQAVMRRVERYLQEDVPAAVGRAEILFLGTSQLGTVQLQVTGPDLYALRYLGAQVASAFYSVDGVEAVRSDWENSVFKLLVELDQDRASRAGLTSEAVANTLTTYYDGSAVTSFREGDTSIPVALRARSQDRGSLDGVRMIEVPSAKTGQPVPLLQVANFRGAAEPSRIRRLNQQRALTLSGKHPDMTADELYRAMKVKLDAIQVPPGYELEVVGEIKDSKESGEKLFEFAPHALFLVLALLVLQFNSFRRPAVILLTIPLILIGANYGLFVFGGFFDFTAMLGLFSLAGIIINNGIVMIDRIDESRQEGASVADAIVEAALSRARPIIMTTVTTVVGLVPLALFGGEFWYGMAVVIMCGLGVGTVLTLGFVPVVYSLFFDLRGRSKPSAKGASA